MKAIFISQLVLVFVLILPLAVAAATPAWTFEQYTGVTQWFVTVTEDDRGCQGGIITNHVNIDITHNGQIADVGDWGHGAPRGTFEGNTLHILSRTVRDGSGSSTLSAFDLTFPPDCSSFTGTYRWDYSDAYQSCSGSTSLTGMRADDPGCPGAPQTSVAEMEQQIADARAEQEASRKESIYAEVLANDSTNFWANWDMAQLKKQQGDYGAFFRYFNGAVSNDNVFQDVRTKLRNEEAQKLHISTWPTANTCPLLRVETGEMNQWNGGLYYDVNIGADQAADKPRWYLKYWTLRVPNASEIVSRLVGPP